ncbi:MAG: ABC transporter substrate-binding protein [Synergistaceae bacterium]|nr:ABC transporter substrate-binding protein [Synergistaceae bacterium]
MKKIFALLLVVASVFFAGMSFADDAPIKIGAMYALTGANAAIGTNILRGIDFAVKMINAQGGVNGRMLEVVRGDTEGDAAKARSVAERLVTQDHVDALLGCHQSTLTNIAAQVCDANEVPLVTAISTVDNLSENGYEYFFRMCPMNSVYVRGMFDYLRDQAKVTGKEIKTIAIFADNSNIGQEIIRCSEIFAPEYGMEIIAKVEYQGGQPDMSSEVLALKNANADAVIAESYINDATLLMKTLQEQNYQPPIIVAKANGYTDPTFLQNNQGISNGVASVVEWNPDITKGQDINAEFKQEYGIDMNGHSAESFTATWILKTAFENAGTTEGSAVKDALKALDIQEKFPNGPEIILPYSRIKFEDHMFAGKQHYNNNIFASIAIAQVQDGKYKTVWPLEYAGAQINYPAEYK